MHSFALVRSYSIAVITSGALLASCVWNKTYEECRNSLSYTTSERDECKTDLSEQKDNINKCLTQMGVANGEKDACIGELRTSKEAYTQCQNGCMIQEFEAFKQRTRDEYQAQLDEYQKSSSEEYRVQVERVTQEALGQQKQFLAKIAELEQRVKTDEEGCESESNGLVKRIEEAQSITHKIGEELKGCYRDLESQAQSQQFRQVIQGFPFGQPQFLPQQRGVYRR